MASVWATLLKHRFSFCSSTITERISMLYSRRPIHHNFTVVKCDLDENSPEVQENYAVMKNVMKTFNKITMNDVMRIDQKLKDYHLSKKKVLVRDRINELLDEGSAFLEFSQLAGYRLYPGEDNLPAGGIITGVGKISGQLCMIVANDATVKGGTYYPITLKKHLRALEIASKHQLPCVYLVDSGGANLKFAAELFLEASSFGTLFWNMARLSAESIPQIAVVMGLCTAGGAYIPAMADESIIVKKTGCIFLAGPPLVKAATGEVISAEELGGSDLHCRVSGVADHCAENDHHALQLTRRIMKRISNERAPLSSKAIYYDRVEPKPPMYPSRYLLGILNPLRKEPFDIKKIIACLVDGSEFDEFKANFGETLITGFARINGYLVGILANNGVLESESAMKGAHFMQLCGQSKTPIIFLQNITGFMVGKDAEASGIAKHGAKMITALSCIQVPKITVIVGGSYGAGNFAMSGRALRPDFMYTWPNSRIAIMGGEQAADVLVSVSKKLTDDEKKKLKEKIITDFDEHSSPYYVSSRLCDDGVIDPLRTREVLSLTLSICLSRKVDDRARYGIFRM